MHDLVEEWVEGYRWRDKVRAAQTINLKSKDVRSISLLCSLSDS